MSERAPIGFYDTVVDRTLSRLRTVWREIATSTREVLSGATRPDLPDDDAQRLRQQMQSCLDGSGGEVSARARAADLGRTYLALNQDGRVHCMRRIAYLMAHPPGMGRAVSRLRNRRQWQQVPELLAGISRERISRRDPQY